MNQNRKMNHHIHLWRADLNKSMFRLISLALLVTLGLTACQGAKPVPAQKMKPNNTMERIRSRGFMAVLPKGP